MTDKTPLFYGLFSEHWDDLVEVYRRPDARDVPAYFEAFAGLLTDVADDLRAGINPVDLARKVEMIGRAMGREL